MAERCLSDYRQGKLEASATDLGSKEDPSPWLKDFWDGARLVDCQTRGSGIEMETILYMTTTAFNTRGRLGPYLRDKVIEAWPVVLVTSSELRLQGSAFNQGSPTISLSQITYCQFEGPQAPQSLLGYVCRVFLRQCDYEATISTLLWYRLPLGILGLRNLPFWHVERSINCQ